jgi:pimeloyl-ACP methyl ester carboxylesterase
MRGTRAFWTAITAVAIAIAVAMALGRPTAAATVRPWRTLASTPLLPHPLASGMARVNRIRMFYAIFGHGQPLLLLHGGLANSNYWSYVIPILVRHRFKVIVADSRGQGRSTTSAEPLTYDLMASDVIGLLDHLGLKKVDLVGWSDGGIIGLDIAIHHPRRLHRLFVYGANSSPVGVRADLGSSPVFAAYLARTRREYADLSPTPRGYDRLLAQIEAMWAHEPDFTRAELGGIAIPVAVADGAHDEAIKCSDTEFLARSIPRGTLIILPDVSHFGMLQNPAEFASAAIAFLRGDQRGDFAGSRTPEAFRDACG